MRKIFLLTFIAMIILFGGGWSALAQEETFDPNDPGANGNMENFNVPTAPTSINPSALQIPTLTNYVDGVPTRIMLPSGEYIDVPVPQNTVAQDGMRLTSVPTIPKANEKVVITVSNYSTKLEEDTITWTVNGQLVVEGIGETSITIQTGNVGETTVVIATIDSRSLKKRLTKTLVITPADLAVLWEADTYTPPFYRGKALPSYKSHVKLVPIPTILGKNGKPIASDKLLYTWKRNFRSAQEISGYGKTSAIVEMGIGSQIETFKLVVKDIDTGAQTERDTVITIVSPQIFFYETTPLQGIKYGKALSGTFSMSEEEIELQAEPFFFSRKEVFTPTTEIVWKKNGRQIQSQTDRTVILRKEGTGSFSARIEAEIRNTARILQHARSTLSISYQE